MAVRQIAIDEIHGCVADLEALLCGLRPEAGDTLVCVGDYIDRGADSRGVIDMVMELANRPDLATVFLRGNHEDMCLSYLGRGGHYGEAWMVNGGGAAMDRYPPAARGAWGMRPLAFTQTNHPLLQSH